MRPEENSPIILTGGTGSFGSAFARFLIDNTQHKIRIYSRSEHQQRSLDEELNAPATVGRITYILGDVRDADQLTQASRGCWAIIHAAALKTVPGGEQHASEFVKTNVTGTQNVIAAALANRIPHSLLISSDKSVQAINLYGASKFVTEKLFLQANRLGGDASRFSVVRGGNVWNSNGSVARVWHEQMVRGEAMTVYDREATRFHLPMDDWMWFCWGALNNMGGGEIFVPKLKAWRLGDLANAFSEFQDHAPPRAGDKQHELLVSRYESNRTVDVDWAYIIEPSEDLRAVWHYSAWDAAPPVPWQEYSSENAERMTAEELRELVE